MTRKVDLMYFYFFESKMSEKKLKSIVQGLGVELKFFFRKLEKTLDFLHRVENISIGMNCLLRM